MKKHCLLFLLAFCFPLLAYAGTVSTSTYATTYRSTNCATLITNARQDQTCLQTTDSTQWWCIDPAHGGASPIYCDDPGDWTQVGGIGTGGVGDGDKGDISATSGGTVWTIDANTITSAKIVDGTIVAGDIANSTLTGGKLADATITGAKLVDSTITNNKLPVVDYSHGGTGQSTAPDGAILMGSETGWILVDPTDCNSPLTDKVLINKTAHTITCGVDQTGTPPPQTFQQTYDASGDLPTMNVGVGGYTITGLTSAQPLMLCSDTNCTITRKIYYDSIASAWTDQTFPESDVILDPPSGKDIILEEGGIPRFRIATGGVFTGIAGSAADLSASGSLKVPTANGAAPTEGSDFRFDDTTKTYVGGNDTTTKTFAYTDLFTTTTPGLVPLSGGGTTNYLRADGTWAAPPGGGGGTTAIANGGTGQVTAQAAINALTQVSGGTNEYVLTKDTGTGNAAWKPVSAGTVSDITTAWAIQSDISPTTLSDDANDYNPASLSTSTVIRLSSDKLVGLTGLVGGADGRVIAFVNIGTNPIILISQSAASTDINRFAFPDIRLLPDASVVLMYDGTSLRWRLFSLAVARTMFDPTSRIIFYEEFIGGNVTGLNPYANNWAGACGGSSCAERISPTGANATDKAMGVVELDTGNSTTGSVGKNVALDQIQGGLGQMIMVVRVQVPILSTSGEDYIARAGFDDSPNSAIGEPTDGIYFEYRRSVDGDFWIGKASKAGVRSKTLPVQAVTTGYIWLMAVTNAAWTSVDYFARPTGQEGWTYLGNIADANIPAAANTTVHIKMTKTAGVTPRLFHVDTFFFMDEMKR